MLLTIKYTYNITEYYKILETIELHYRNNKIVI
jgi:hypothetical protein